jgi:tetratricopeptide (TPR) repeat protein
MWQMEAGRTYSRAGRTSDAILATKKALSWFESRNDAEHVARAKSNLAIFMLDSELEEEVAEAEATLEHACDIKIGLGDAEGASTNFSQLSMHHLAHNRFEKARAYGRKDLKLSRFVGNDVMTAATLNNMGYVYSRVLQLAQARNLVREAEGIGQRLESRQILQTSAKLLRSIENIGRTTGEQQIKVGKLAVCACKSGKKYIDCCGRADHEPVALRMPVGGPSEDIDDIRAALRGTGLRLVQLDYAMRESKESRSRIAWSEMRAHDGWFEIFELPDMANIHLNAAEALAKQAGSQADAIHEPIACVMLAVSALEALINSTAYFAKDAANSRPLDLPEALLADAFAYQRRTELTKKWDDLGSALCLIWPPPSPIWESFLRLIQLRNELVHYKTEGFAKVAPIEKVLPEQLRNLPSEIELRGTPSSWSVRLLTPSFARWSVRVTKDMIHHFKSSYRFTRQTEDTGSEETK